MTGDCQTRERSKRLDFDSATVSMVAQRTSNEEDLLPLFNNRRNVSGIFDDCHTDFEGATLCFNMFFPGTRAPQAKEISV